MSEPRIIDLDAARKARAEVDPDQQPPIVRFGGKDFELPAEMPFEFAALAMEQKIDQAVRLLLGDQADAFFEKRPSLSDILVFAEGVGKAYGVDVGEPLASSGS